MKNVICGRCVKCGKEYPAVPNLTNCECGGILDIIYDYDYIKAHLTKEMMAERKNNSMWRYRELLPVEEDTPDTPLRVGWSPLYEADRLAKVSANENMVTFRVLFQSAQDTVNRMADAVGKESAENQKKMRAALRALAQAIEQAAGA